MADYETFTNKWSMAAGATLDEDTHFNDPGDGVQDEFEERWGYMLDGVTNGLTTSTASSTLTIAAGDAIVAGKRYGSGSIDYTGKASGDYYNYIDSTDDTTPYKAKTTAPTSGELTVSTCSWNGSAFTDLDDQAKVQGIQDVAIPFSFPGTLSTDMRWIVPIYRNAWIEDLEFACVNNGSVSGGVTLDLLLGSDGSEGTTVYTTTSRRPTVLTSTAAYTIASGGDPDGDRRPDAGEHLTISVAAIDGGGTAMTCSGILTLRWR